MQSGSTVTLLLCAVVTCAVVTSSLAQSSCPVADVPECECVHSFNIYSYIVCEDYHAEHLPPFQASNVTFTSVSFLRSRVRSIRREDLLNIRAQTLHLDALEIESIEERAFVGLGGFLQELYLDSNALTSLGGTLHYYVTGCMRLKKRQ